MKLPGIVLSLLAFALPALGDVLDGDVYVDQNGTRYQVNLELHPTTNTYKVTFTNLATGQTGSQANGTPGTEGGVVDSGAATLPGSGGHRGSVVGGKAYDNETPGDDGDWHTSDDNKKRRMRKERRPNGIRPVNGEEDGVTVPVVSTGGYKNHGPLQAPPRTPAPQPWVSARLGCPDGTTVPQR